MDGSAEVRDLLTRGIAACKDGGFKEARFFLEWALRLDCSHEQRLRALFYLSEAAATPAERYQYLEDLLVEDPTHPEARRRLAELRGQLNKGDIVANPDRLPREAPARIKKQKAVCESCGGRLMFTPDGAQLECERCGKRSAPAEPAAAEEPGKGDFVVALAQATGHQTPRVDRTFDCPSCGAAFSLPESSLSHQCPFCRTNFIPHSDPREWIPPDAVVLFRADRDAALRAMNDWCADQGFPRGADPAELRGLYLPVWDFDIGGRMQMCASNGAGPFAEWPVNYPHVLIPATTSWPKELEGMIHGYDLSGTAPYDPGMLADWIAELYKLPPAEASLLARARVVDEEIARIPKNASGFPSSAEVDVLTVRLILLPVWSGLAAQAGTPRRIFVNGQTGETAGESLPG